jgi:hypothetical protein
MADRLPTEKKTKQPTPREEDTTAKQLDTLNPNDVVVQLVSVHDTLGGTKTEISVVDDVQLSEHELMCSVHHTVLRTLADFGFDINMRGVVEPKHIAMFILTHAIGAIGSPGAWYRIFRAAIDARITADSIWQDITSPNGVIVFEPEMWRRIFTDIECHISHAAVEASSYLSNIAHEMSAHRIDPRTRIFPAVVLKFLLERNSVQFADNEAFTEYMFSGAQLPPDARRDLLNKFFACMRKLTAESVIPEENAIVMLLCASKFREVPFFDTYYINGTIPVFRNDPRRPAVSTTTTKTKKNKKKSKTPAVAPKQNDTVDARHHMITEEPKKAPVTSEPVVAKQPEPPQPMPFDPYPSRDSRDFTALMALFADTRSTFPTALQQELFVKLEHASTHPGSPEHHLYQVVDEYRRAMGIVAHADIQMVVQSMLVCLFGGSIWAAVHGSVLPDIVVPADQRGPRTALSKLDVHDMAAIIGGAIDYDAVKVMPTELADAIGEFTALAASTQRKSAAGVRTRTDTLRKILAIYWDTTLGVGEQPPDFGFLDLWREMGWYIDACIAEDIEKTWLWSSERFMPSTIRALTLATFANAAQK